MLAKVFAVFLRACPRKVAEAGAFKGGEVRFGVLNIPRDAIDEMRERRRAAHEEIAATVRVAVDVNHGVLLEFGVVSFAPFGGTEKSFLFAIPCAIDDGALRAPALFP